MIQSALTWNKPSSIVVNTAIDLVAWNIPTVGVLVATYKVSKVLYKIASKAEEEYGKTGDANSAATAATQEVVKSAVDMTRGEAINTVVDVGWTAIKSTAHLQTNEVQDRVLTTAAKNTLDEVLPK